MGRTKGALNKPKPLPILAVSKVKFQPPTIPAKYKAKRAFWFLLALEKKIMVDPTSVTPARYQEALEYYIKSADEALELKSVRDRSKRAKTRMELEAVARNELENDQATDSRDGSPGVGVGIPPINPLA